MARNGVLPPKALQPPVVDKRTNFRYTVSRLVFLPQIRGIEFKLSFFLTILVMFMEVCLKLNIPLCALQQIEQFFLSIFAECVSQGRRSEEFYLDCSDTRRRRAASVSGYLQSTLRKFLASK